MLAAMGEPSRDVTVRTRFADAPMLMASLEAGITRGALRLPAAIAVGATFEVALLTAGGEVAARGTAEAIRADGPATLVRFLSATDDGGDRETSIDLAGATVSVPTALQRNALPPLAPLGKRGRRAAPPPVPTPTRAVDPSAASASAAASAAADAQSVDALWFGEAPTTPETASPLVEPPAPAAAPRAATASIAEPPLVAPPLTPSIAPPLTPSIAPSAPPPLVDAPASSADAPAIFYSHTADTMSPPSIFPLPPGASITIPPPVGGTATTIPLPFGASITIPPAMGNTIPPPMRHTIPPPVASTMTTTGPFETIAPPPPPSRAMRGMLGASVIIAVAGAAVAVSAVLWARQVKSTDDRSTTPAPKTQPLGASLARTANPVPVPDPESVPEPESVPVPEPESVPVPVPVAVPEPEPEPVAVPAAVPDPVPRTIASQTCRTTITSNADGAAIFIDGTRRGETPATLDLPCTPATLVLKHPRYQISTRRIEPTPAGIQIDASLIRPKSLLRVVSRPAGATVTLGRRPVGKTPLTVAVDGYEKQSLVVTASGYEPDRRTVYVRGESHVITTTLRRR